MYTNRVNVKLSLHDFQGCSDDCQKAISVNPEYSNSYFILGLLFLTVEQQNNAFKAFKVAESRSSTSNKYY
jgi:Tfp pilus assembly protein PilF